MTSESENNKKLNDFFGKEYNSLKSYVNSRIKSSVNRDAEDIIQDVALNLFSRASIYTPINNVAGFVYRSLRNKIVDVLRSNQQPINSDDVKEARLIEFTELLYDTSDNIYSEQMKDELKKNIMNLKPDYRNIIIAFDFEGYTYKEISFETGIPEGTLMSRRHRAISLLHKKLETKKEIIN
ncbi:RNA polymerase sigma factor [Urechidicola croceus]|uniref:RNA polymerase subunit sigma-24 n=1 Tax=Urechidicola croceus TaxID=1850246 RepID=A0A1D8PBD9_9FLAO|nr:RNA polymerase sigma factor [Urechidicola croceus]AOW21894.1 RNA polymerase subunit sigma-24 [Urechidicola croceus]